MVLEGCGAVIAERSSNLLQLAFCRRTESSAECGFCRLWIDMLQYPSSDFPPCFMSCYVSNAGPAIAKVCLPRHENTVHVFREKKSECIIFIGPRVCTCRGIVVQPSRLDPIGRVYNDALAALTFSHHSGKKIPPESSLSFFT